VNDSRIKICLASSVGGHLSELLQLRPVYSGFDHFYIVNDSLLLPDVMKDRTYFIRHSERDLLCVWNLWEAFRIFRRERLFIETFAAIHKPTLTGRIVYHIANESLYQWEQLRPFYPRGTYAGDVFGICDSRQCNSAV
jgi:beta-1,4-N-acetylglucosaminyltransferase